MMNYPRYFLLFVGLLVGQLQAQKGVSPTLSVRLGAAAGAPIPTTIDSSASGTLHPWITVGVTSKIIEFGKFALGADLLYVSKMASYESAIPRTDTTVIQTVWGIDTEVKTYYTGNVKGRMNLHYLELPIQLSYYLGNRFRLMTGPHLSYLIAGQDTGTAHIVVGNNFTQSKGDFNNRTYVRNLDMGWMGGMCYDFPFGLSIDLRLQRSFRNVYTPAFAKSNANADAKLYQTYGHFGISYRIFKG